jgi:hypothetical protein
MAEKKKKTREKKKKNSFTGVRDRPGIEKRGIGNALNDDDNNEWNFEMRARWGGAHLVVDLADSAELPSFTLPTGGHGRKKIK